MDDSFLEAIALTVLRKMNQNTCQNEVFRCNIAFGRHADLCRHEDEQHYPPKQCPWCEFTDRRYYKVVAHVTTCRGNESFRCLNKCAWSWCEFVESRDTILREHMTARHPKRPYKKVSGTNLRLLLIASHRSFAQYLVVQEQSQESMDQLLVPGDLSNINSFSGEMRYNQTTSAMLPNSYNAFEELSIEGNLQHWGPYPQVSMGTQNMQTAMSTQNDSVLPGGHLTGAATVPLDFNYRNHSEHYPSFSASPYAVPAHPTNFGYPALHAYTLASQSAIQTTFDDQYSGKTSTYSLWGPSTDGHHVSRGFELNGTLDSHGSQMHTHPVDSGLMSDDSIPQDYLNVRFRTLDAEDGSPVDQ
ncbi:hypothetical protein VTL71DRAFT_6402 [Oculimacula yallundae]|uniref:C2H2-type domain-containing protein n=1 Tax=Oculimacula yallundae TaxID=86028 RepID=A0ABR4BY13_9HELO